MSVSSVSYSVLQVPLTPQARISDEQSESAATKSREARTGKDVAVAVQASVQPSSSGSGTGSTLDTTA
jgi:hypothetical protein